MRHQLRKWPNYAVERTGSGRHAGCCRFAPSSHRAALRLSLTFFSLERFPFESALHLVESWFVMPAPYSLDLRERIWAAWKAKEGTREQIAERFGVSLSCVRDLLRRVRESGSAVPKPHGGGRSPAFDEQGLEVLAQAVAESPDATLEELKIKLRRERRLRVSRSALGRAVLWLRLTRKKEGSPRQRT
jgi:transposase